MPQTPDNLAAVVSYLYKSCMLHDFDGMEGADEKVRDRKIKALNKQYCFEEALMADGRVAWKVDEYIPRTFDGV